MAKAKRDWVRVLLLSAAGVLIAGAVFAAAAAVIWPARWPAWAARASGVCYLAGLLLGAGGGLIWLRRRGA